ncbi:inhibitor of Bruton tyrosine kinase [Anoplophora glabripennis]|nr:inhibitor of Bruton tyrosine kinase [Anoplophora glabripennis]
MSSTTANDIPDCTIYCKSVQHGDIITAALSKRSISEFDLCAFLNYTCMRCESVRDSTGRTALHVAASCGRAEVVKWLICSRHADIEAKDKESGYTALHRSIFYGKIHVAVELIKLGASVSELDLDHLTILEHAMKDGLQPDTNYGELYCWGSNNNNLLGPQQARESPELLDVFHKEHPNECVKQICIDQFHSVIITISGKAYSCGHGQGGRLGLGIEQAVVSPRIINFLDTQKGDIVTCLQASISRDHSIFLCSDGNIYTCGLNTYRVLGIQPPPVKLLIPKPIKHFISEAKGVCSGRYHSVTWGSKSLYTWGLNGGQLGHKINNKTEEQYIVTPKKVKFINIDEVDIRAVAASDGATAVCTDRGDIYVLHEFLCRKIASRQLNVVQIDITGGKVDATSLNQESKKSQWELKVVALTNTGNLLLWQQSDPQLCRCIFSINRAIIAKHVAININEVLLVTDYGEAFKGNICQRKKKHVNLNNVEKNVKGNEKSAFHKFLEKEDCTLVQLKKICKIHRAIFIQSDTKGKDFCIIQALPYKLFEFPKIIDSEMQKDLNTLLDNADESDNIHDIVFKVGQKYFPAHRYIISTKSPYFEELFCQSKEEVITLNDVHDAIFEQFLLYIYTGCCDLTSCGELKSEVLRNMHQNHSDLVENSKLQENEAQITSDMSAYEYYQNTKHEQKIKLLNSSQNLKNPIRMLQELAKRYGCKELHNTLSNLEMQKCVIRFKHAAESKLLVPMVFNRMMFPNFYDITIKCRDNKEIMAHKCILAARLEYFNNMFSMRWKGAETSEVTLPFPKSIAEALLEFLYTDSVTYLNGTDIDHLFKILILADQLFVIRLKEQCESLLTNLLTLKNAVQLLSFADSYNAKKLKHCCMKFITLNITAFLELRSLEELDDELLIELSEFYFQNTKKLSCRFITPYSVAPLDEEIISLTSLHNFSLKDEVEQKVLVKSSQKRKSRAHKISLSEKNKSLDNDIISLDNLIQFPDIPEVISESKKDSKNMPDRVKAITLASEKIKGEDIEPQFTKLSSNKNYSSSSLSRSFNEENDFPELNSPPLYSNNSFYHKTPPQKIDSKHKIIRLSQKQRKRLSSESNNNIGPSTPESPKNPWKIIPDISSSPISAPDTKSTITDIIYHEKRQKENLVKITTKLLTYTQIEDRAIDELHKFYNCDDVTDEIITIERVAIGAIASPVWVPRTK